MANPPKKKGTGFETERVNTWLADGIDAKREPQGAPYDITVYGDKDVTIEALTVRADHGEAMTLIPHDVFRHLVAYRGAQVHEECKRYARINLCTIYRKKFKR
jgi:hypothetical protein